MSLIKGLSKLTDRLASLYLFKGIQPSEIADAIFENNYSNVTLDRTESEIVLVASFTEFDEVSQTEYKHQIKYIYSKNKCLQVIEQRVGNKRFKVQWSRQEEIDKLVNEFVGRVQNILSKEQLGILLSTLPKEIRPQVKTRLKLVA